MNRRAGVVLGCVRATGARHLVVNMTGSGGARMGPFRWRRAFFLGLVSYAASLAGLVFDTFVPVFLQAGHPLAAERLLDLAAPRGPCGAAPLSRHGAAAAVAHLRHPAPGRR